MLQVLTPEEAVRVLERELSDRRTKPEEVALSGALGRVLARAVESDQFVPDFDRSTVDGRGPPGPGHLRLFGQPARPC